MSTIQQPNERLDQFSPLNHIRPLPGLKNGSFIGNRSRKVEWVIYILTLLLSDLILTFFAFKIAYWLRFYSGLPFFSDGLKITPFYDSIMFGVIPIWLSIFWAMGLYSRSKLLGGVREYAQVFNAITLGMLLIITARFAFPEALILARGWAFSAWFLAFVLVVVGRFMLRRVVYFLRTKGLFRTNAVIVGLNEEGLSMAEQLHSSHISSMNLIGFVNTEECSPDAAPAFLHCLGNLEDLETIVRTRHVSRVILTSSALSRVQVLNIFQQFTTSKDTELMITSGLYEVITTGLNIQEDGFVPLVTMNKLRMTGFDHGLKRLMDLVLAIGGVLVLSPALILIALLVKLDSPGPIIYRRRVMGVNGTQFDAFKFRTMDTRSEEILQANPELMREYLTNFKLKEDPRITRIGKYLRKASLDELPQLFNVILGQMSIVGPRMITPQELEKYNQWGFNLLTVKPGISGLWQVRGRSDVSYEERVRLDMYYIRNWTIWVDIQIALQTIPAVLAKRGAY